MKNSDIEKLIREKKLKKWEVAEAVEIADTTFSKWLRRELSQERKTVILTAIEKLARERKNHE